ncbi:MAG: Rpn family recombination-promoting nuclease/putative transposase [Firmicutes bacterium]|nr:Rpn family recombination-promoting nuclease/putative transposase [Bacillota bacterium]
MSDTNKKYSDAEIQEIIDNIPIVDDILFTTVISNEEIAKSLLEVILNVTISKITRIERESQRSEVSNLRGVRFDVYIEDDKTAYDIEIQTSDNGDLPKRTRFYQAKNDIHMLRKGEKHFSKLKKSYIIFICTFHLFENSDTNECIYTFENICLTNNKVIKLKDDAYRVFVNSECDLNKIKNNNLRAFIELIKDGFHTNIESPLTNKILNEIDRVKRNEGWRTNYMTQKERDLDMMHRGELKGQQEERIQMIRGMLDNNIDINIISSISKLSIQEIKEIQESMLVK